MAGCLPAEALKSDPEFQKGWVEAGQYLNFLFHCISGLYVAVRFILSLAWLQFIGEGFYHFFECSLGNFQMKLERQDVRAVSESLVLANARMEQILSAFRGIKSIPMPMKHFTRRGKILRSSSELPVFSTSNHPISRWECG